MDDRSEVEPLNQIERLEVLFVGAAILIFILMAFFGPGPRGSVDRSDVAAAKAQIKQFETALMAYKIKFKRLPDNLERLLSPPYGQSIMIGKEVPLDPWDTPYLYLPLDTTFYVIVSLGADGTPGGKGEDADICSDEFMNAAAQ